MARKSVLFSPGDRPELLRKAPNSGADSVVLDLEDSVAPQQKDTARATVHETLSDSSYDPDVEVLVRLNAGQAAETDLDALIDSPPDGVIVPKVGTMHDVLRIVELLESRNLNCQVLALLESAEGVLNAPSIASVSATSALALGAEDLAAGLGATRTGDGTEILYARERIVLAAAAAGIECIDTPHTDFEDDDDLREDAQQALSLGFDGKLAIHPKQVSIINEAFTPDETQIEWANRVVAAREEAARDNRGVFEVDGQMIDAPLLTRAERILERAGVDSASNF